MINNVIAIVYRFLSGANPWTVFLIPKRHFACQCVKIYMIYYNIQNDSSILRTHELRSYRGEYRKNGNHTNSH